jgi:hypothetical protein
MIDGDYGMVGALELSASSGPGQVPLEIDRLSRKGEDQYDSNNIATGNFVGSAKTDFSSKRAVDIRRL